MNIDIIVRNIAPKVFSGPSVDRLEQSLHISGVTLGGPLGFGQYSSWYRSVIAWRGMGPENDEAGVKRLDKQYCYQ